MERNARDRKEWTNNMQRCADMIECKEQLDHWQERWKKLKLEHEQACLRQTLIANPCYWGEMPTENQWTKSTILLMYKHSRPYDDEVMAAPMVILEHYICNSTHCSLKNDKEVFFARLNSTFCRSNYLRRNHRLHIPRLLLDDKEVLIYILEKYIACRLGDQDCLMKSLPTCFGDDSDLYCAMLKGIENVPHNKGLDLLKSYLPHFSSRLRNDCRMIDQFLEFVKGPCFDFLIIFLKECHVNNERCVYPSILRNNKAFFMQNIDIKANHYPDNALMCFSKRLRDDSEFVRAVVKRNGMCLQHASYRLRRDKKTVSLACQSDPRALFCSLFSLSRKKSFANEELLLSILGYLSEETYEKNFCCIPQIVDWFGKVRAPLKYINFWNSMKMAFLQDENVVIAALIGGCISLDEVPEHFKQSRTFWTSAVESCTLLWVCLPEKFAHSIELAKTFTAGADGPLVRIVFDRCPDLRVNREIWKNIVLRIDDMEPLIDLLQHKAPRFILLDRELMVVACQRDPAAWSVVAQPLADEEDIVRACLQSAEGLFEIPDTLQLIYPWCVADAIRAIEPTADVWDYFNYVDEDVWIHRDVALAWLSKGGNYLHEEFEEEMDEDEEAFLLIAQHRPEDFWCASEILTKNKDFMMKVLDKRPILFREVSGDLRKDFDIVLQAISGGNGSVSSTKEGIKILAQLDINDDFESFQVIVRFAKGVRDRLMVYENYTLLLCGISIQNQPSSCNIQLLNQGNETLKAYNALFAEYLDVPRGMELKRLKQAAQNLCSCGF